MYNHYQKLLDEKKLKNADVARGANVSNMTLSERLYRYGTLCVS